MKPNTSVSYWTQLPGALLNFSSGYSKTRVLLLWLPGSCCSHLTKTSPALNPFYFCVGGGMTEHCLLKKKKKTFQKLEKQPRWSELRSKWALDNPRSSPAQCDLERVTSPLWALVLCLSFSLPVPFAFASGFTIFHPNHIMITIITRVLLYEQSFWGLQASS